MKKTVLVALLLVFVLAFFLRVIFLKNLSLTFGYDQARDAYVSQEILKGDLKVLGPPASTPGLYHGVFYYYLLAPAYYLGHGSPIVAAYWIALLNALTVFIVFYLSYLFTKSQKAGLVAAILFAISFEATQYATWLSNPTIGVWTVPLFYLGLWVWIKEKKSWGPIVAAIGLGLSIQAEIFLLYHAVPLVLWLWFARKNIDKKSLIKFGIFFLLSISTILISEIKFGFKGIGGVLSLLTTQDSIVASKGLGDFLLLFINQIGRVFAYSSYPGNVGYGGVFVLILIIMAIVEWRSGALASRSREGEVGWQPFIVSWLLSHITVVSVGGTSTPFLLVGIGPAVSIILGIFIYNLASSGGKAIALVVFWVIVLGNILMIFKENPKGSTIFAIQKDMILKKQLSVIDYTYNEAKGRPFSINSLTSPLWINIVWTYLYKWYGQPKYGYIPEWHGKDQVGQLDSLPKTDKDTKQYFLVIEPLAGIPLRYLDETVGEENSYSGLVSERYFGDIKIEERLRKDIKK